MEDSVIPLLLIAWRALKQIENTYDKVTSCTQTYLVPNQMKQLSSIYDIVLEGINYFNEYWSFIAFFLLFS